VVVRLAINPNTVLKADQELDYEGYMSQATGRGRRNRHLEVPT
jgi:DNA-binding transcriptional regulator YhcF (GntR family)